MILLDIHLPSGQIETLKVGKVIHIMLKGVTNLFYFLILDLPLIRFGPLFGAWNAIFFVVH